VDAGEQMKDINNTSLKIGDYVEFRTSGALYSVFATPFDKFGIIEEDAGSMIRIRYIVNGVSRTQSKYPGNLRKLTDISKIMLLILEN
jgi:hypothetical protein